MTHGTTEQHGGAAAYGPPALPEVRKIRLGDLNDALAEGWADFKAKPTYVLLLGILYPIIGLFLARLTFGYDVLPLLFPLAAGFALVGPFAAIGFYEISRRRELGEEPSWWSVFGLLGRKSPGSILALGALLTVIFFIWIGVAETIFRTLFGPEPLTSLSFFVHQVFETPQGKRLAMVGIGVGFLFALLTFSIGVVSFPLMMDRDVSAPAAMITSVKAVVANPFVMMAWATIITAALIVGSLPLFLGLAVVLPMFGHASWHIYRKVVV
jgi:uncharacterized membrane protein